MKEYEKARADAATSPRTEQEKTLTENSPITEYNTFSGPVASLLQEGRENAVGAEYLCLRLGLPSSRALRKEIERERREGALILSNMEKGGYYLPGSIEEVRDFKETMESRARSTFLSIRSARKYLKEHEEQR